MKFSLAFMALPALMIASAASAEGWTHAAAAMGQFEGSYSSEDESFGVNYGCSPSYSQVGFQVKGLHIAAGESTIAVDGKAVATGNTTYNSKWDATSFTTKVQAEWGPKLKTAHNDLINAIAKGSKAVWTTPSGESYEIDLTGSSDIKSCLIS